MSVFNNQQPNQGDFQNRNNVNTRGIQLYNINGFYPSTVKFDFWNDSFASIAIFPAKAKELQTEKDRYDYENRIAAAVSHPKVMELLDNIPRIIKAYEDGQDANSYVDIAGNNLFGYGTMKNKDGKQIFYLAVHKDLDDNRIPRQSAYYEFNFTQSISEYDPKTGNYAMVASKLGEFAIFRKYLEEAYAATTHAVAHSVKVAHDYWMRRLDAKVDAVVKATNARVEGFSSGNRARLFGGNADTATMKDVVKSAEDAATKNTVTTELPGADDIPF